MPCWLRRQARARPRLWAPSVLEAEWCSGQILLAVAATARGTRRAERIASLAGEPVAG